MELVATSWRLLLLGLEEWAVAFFVPGLAALEAGVARSAVELHGCGPSLVDGG